VHFNKLSKDMALLMVTASTLNGYIVNKGVRVSEELAAESTTDKII
jgi:hypothetical protein